MGKIMDKKKLDLGLINLGITNFLVSIGPGMLIDDRTPLFLERVCDSIDNTINLLGLAKRSEQSFDIWLSLTLMLLASNYGEIKNRLKRVQNRLERTNVNYGLINLDEIDEIYKELNEIQNSAQELLKKCKEFVTREGVAIEFEFQYNSEIDEYIKKNNLNSEKSGTK